MTSDGIRARQASDGRGEWFLLTDELSADDAQVSGRWLKARNPVEVRQ
jgi:hypothetical protein